MLFAIQWFRLLLLVAPTLTEPCRFNPLCSCSAIPLDVSCLGVPLVSLPSLPLEDVYQVSLVRSGLELLANDAFGGTRVSSLRIVHGHLQHVGPKAFRGSEHFLTSFDASFNHLYEVPTAALRKLPYLQWLNLHSNRIENAEPEIWSSLESKFVVKNVFLGENNVVLLRDGSFADLSNLTSLDLDGNRLDHLEGYPFPPSLLKLSLRDNLLHSVPLVALNNLESLTWLQLGGNLIRHLPKTWKLPVKFLQKLDLSHNLLSTISENFLNGTVAVRDLHLDFNYIRVLPGKVFHGIAIERLSLSNNRLTSIPDYIFDGLSMTLKALDISYNLLETLPIALKKLSSLRQLFLRGNQLTWLNELVFFGFRDCLEILDVSDNLIDNIPRDAFSLLRNLARLNIQGNCIQEIRDHDFHGWGASLIALNLDNNGLQYLSREAFSSTPNLRELRISYNDILHQDCDFLIPLRKTLEILEMGQAFNSGKPPLNAMKHMEKLEWLQLDNNNLKNISNSVLSGLYHLVHCDLVESNIFKIDAGVFDPETHSRLSNILLSYNHLNNVPSGAFSNLPHLANVMLIGNKIKRIATQSFLNLPNLQTVVLTDNQISFVEEGAFSNLSRLANVYLQDNELTDLSWNMFSSVGDLNGLIYLNISNNKISKFKNCTDNTLYVRTLDLSRNHISELTTDFLCSVSERLFYLYLSHNSIGCIREEYFSGAKHLQVLHLDHNNISFLPTSVFHGCASLQILDLSHNCISAIMSETFTYLKRLRIVDLSFNQITVVSDNVFAHGTRLEKIILSGNKLLRPPLPCLLPARVTLRYLDLSASNITSLPVTEMSPLANLLLLNVSQNRLTTVAEDTFRNHRHLLHLDLSHNPIWRLDSMTLEPLLSLRSLHLRNSSLASVPFLPLPHLRKLDLSWNLLTNLSEWSLRDMNRLRYLDLSHNLLHEVPQHLWKNLRHLLGLDISHNPIEVLAISSFHELHRLQELDLRGLSLRILDSRTLYGLRFLRTFKTSTYSCLRAFRLHDLLSKSESLRRVLVEVEEATLSHQLQWTFGAKLRELVVTGRALEKVLPDAFLGLHHTHELVLRITGTNVTKLPNHLIRYLADVRYLTLDLRDNLLLSMVPEVLTIGQQGKNIGTRHITGGVLVSGNPWVCSCELVWLGQWIKRWLRETLRAHMLQFDAALHAYNMAAKARCRMLTDVERTVPLVELSYEMLGCTGFTNSTRTSKGQPHMFFFVLIVLTLYRNFRWWSLKDNLTHRLQSLHDSEVTRCKD